jgi:hypothetical protein
MPCEQPIRVAIVSIVTLLSAQIKSSTRCTFASVAISVGRPTWCSSSIALQRTSAPNWKQLDVTGTSHHRWEAFLYEYSLIPYLLPTKIAQRSAARGLYTTYFAALQTDFHLNHCNKQMYICFRPLSEKCFCLM